MSEWRERKDFRYSRSLFGPIFLIALGVYFLLNNLNVIPSLNWALAFQLWPLLLIFLGLNLIVQQARRPIGSLLSALLGLLAALLLGYALLAGSQSSWLQRLNQPVNITTEPIAFAPADVVTADIQLDLGSPGAHVYALSDSHALIDGSVNYVSDLVFDTAAANGHASVSLREASPLTFFNPVSWSGLGPRPRWQIGLDPSVAVDLRVASSSGVVEMDLASLHLTELKIDSGSGAVTATLPGGDYDADVNSGSGAVRITLPADGRHHLAIDSGSGSVSLFLPRQMEARIEVDGGSGPFLPDPRLRQESGDHRDGVWQTPGYREGGANVIELTINSGSGSVSIEPPRGR